MSESDAAHWDEIQRWKDVQMRPIRPRVISQRVRSAALAPLGKAVSIARKVPGGEALTRTVSSAALGLVELAASASEASVRRKRILKAYRSAGFDVRTLQDIRSLTLDDVPHRQAPPEPGLFDDRGRRGRGERRLRLGWFRCRSAWHGRGFRPGSGRHGLGDCR